MKVYLETVNRDRQNYLSFLKLADPDETMVKSYLDSGELFKIVVGDKVVGVLHLVEIDDETLEIKNIAILPEYRGRHIGSTALQSLIELCRGNHYKRIYVGTANSSIENFKFYQKNGFRFDHIVPDFFSNYDQSIYENGIQALDMLYLVYRFDDKKKED
ncbi:GNAT family N-acetyltransferase [Lentilactobacillus hilgardii]|uniref:GNAT family N-acetyltransferase n=1 Tax=Lentilactobacillus hilgardii TaxID=1588 RepID=A0A6P1EFF0_LENHI|nr:GNAT family N-acetyltransferase [Lentilactobacillus hilgardii]EEI70683.1 acetyltransferase, GNAT family [Lentilactobacillus hilgardii ATCC 27305]MCT3390427.1 GNAT family N-acetyltransferase [Lentilactobacillus hilgardii]QHB52684.1 GNAT family N-acetyltransferase [Lentilactobacillus hilgardii]RRG09335.1 MAG: GNAT family N-acetyltransferase [Lactobacillus sp.]